MSGEDGLTETDLELWDELGLLEAGQELRAIDALRNGLPWVEFAKRWPKLNRRALDLRTILVLHDIDLDVDPLSSGVEN